MQFDWRRNAARMANEAPDLAGRLESAEGNPAMKVFPSKKGALTAKVDNVSLHSAYDPESEAENLVSHFMSSLPTTSLIIVFGFGLGYHAEALRRKFNGRIMVVDPDLSLVKTSLQSRDMEGLGNVDPAFGLNPQQVLAKIDIICKDNSEFRSIQILSHAPSLKLNREYFEELKRQINLRRNQNVGRLGILVATPPSGGSLPVARYCINAFERLGHRVEVLDNSIYDPIQQSLSTLTQNRSHTGQLQNLLSTLMSETITARALDRAVDLVFTVAQSPISSLVMKEMKTHNIPLVHWFVEDWKVQTMWKHMALLYDYYFTIQKTHFFDQLRHLGVQNFKYVPLAADPEIHRPLTLSAGEQDEFGSTLSHVGAGYRNRRKVFSRLTDLDFKIWGTDWGESEAIRGSLQRNGQRISTEDSVKIFNATKININLHSSPFHDGVNSEGDFVNPRTFELAASAAFQLTDHRELLPEMFDYGDEISIFRDTDELRELIRSFQSDAEARKEIADKARQRVLRDHTYDARMKDILDYVYSIESVPASCNHPDHIDNLIAGAGDDTELVDLLVRFKGRGVVTLDDIITDISKRDGDLNKAEATFLLMYEFRRWAREREAA